MTTSFSSLLSFKIGLGTFSSLNIKLLLFQIPIIIAHAVYGIDYKDIFDKFVTEKESKTGALSDLEKVTKMTYPMVIMYGLSKKVGNISY